MEYLEPFEWSERTMTFEERVGRADLLKAAVGMVVMNFANLSGVLNAIIRHLETFAPCRQPVDLAALSFVQRILALASLVAQLEGAVAFNVSEDEATEYFRELRQQCLRADALYRWVSTARWGNEIGPAAGEILAPETGSFWGRQRVIGVIDANMLVDIADFTVYVEEKLDQFVSSPEWLAGKAEGE